MPVRQIDPERLEGEALRRWYLRSPEEIERQRQAKAEVEHNAFFGGLRPAWAPSVGAALQLPQQALGGLVGADVRSLGNDVDPAFTWRPAGADRWRRDKVPSWGRGTRPVPLLSPALGPKDEWSRPVPLPSIQLQTSGPRPVPLSQLYPGASVGSAVSSSTTTQSVRSMSNQPSAHKGERQQASAVQPQRHGVWIAGRQPGEIDPSRTEVFQPGPDGKLHTIPGWRTTGPFEFDAWARMFDWRGVAGDLADIGAGALDFMGGGGLAGEVVKGLGYKIGPDVVRGIINGHHAWPKFMGGPSKQELARLYRSLHVDFHVDLEAALKQAGFPRIGGKGGGAANWAGFFAKNVGKRDEAVAILQRITREFDRKNGTKVSKYLDDSLAKGKDPAPPQPQ